MLKESTIRRHLKRLRTVSICGQNGRDVLECEVAYAIEQGIMRIMGDRHDGTLTDIAQESVRRIRREGWR